MILWICTGLVVLDEKAFYTGAELFAIFFCVVVCFLGIKLLTMKTKILQIEAAKERADSLTSKSTCEDRVMMSARSNYR